MEDPNNGSGWAAGPSDRGEGQWPGWLASSSGVMTGRPQKGCDFLFEGGLLSIVRRNSLTLVRLRDGLGYISV